MDVPYLLNDLLVELKCLDLSVKYYTDQAHELLKSNDDYLRVQQIPGIGPMVASTTLAAAGDAQQFKNGRQFSAWIGIPPRHHSSGDKCHLGGMSKRGYRCRGTGYERVTKNGHFKLAKSGQNRVLLTTKLFECFPELKRRYWGRHFCARGYFCVTSGELTSEMIQEYLDHHFETEVDDHFRTEY